MESAREANRQRNGHAAVRTSVGTAGSTRVRGSGARYPRQNTREERGKGQRQHVGPL